MILSPNHKRCLELTIVKALIYISVSIQQDPLYIFYINYRVHYRNVSNHVSNAVLYWNPFSSTVSSFIMAEIINLKYIESAINTIEQSAMVRRTPLLKNVEKIFGFADQFKLHLKMESMQNTGEQRRQDKSLSFRFLVC